jgi:hypothetical protein
MSASGYWRRFRRCRISAEARWRRATVKATLAFRVALSNSGQFFRYR